MAYGVITEFLFPESVSPEEFLILESSRLSKEEFSSTTENSDEYRYMAMDDSPFRTATLEGALENIIESGGGSLEVRFHELKISISFYSPEMAGEMNVQLTADVWASQFKLWDDCTETGVQRRTEQYISFVKLLSETFDPLYALGGLERLDDIEELLPPINQIRRGEITRVFWLNVFSSIIVERLGREHIFSSPAWKIDQLENDSVMLVVSDNPVHPSKRWQNSGKRVAANLGVEW